MTTPAPLYYLGNHRTPDQHAEMVRLAAAGICLFCPERPDTGPERPAASPERDIIHRTALWTVIPNEYPYRGARLHLLLVPDEHVTDLVDLSDRAKADFWTALGWVRDHYGLAHYGLGARNGDPRCTGGTIYHLHVHVIVGDVDDPDHEPVRMKFSSRPA